MKSVKKPGVTRSPIEYVLWAVIVLLVMALLLIARRVRQSDAVADQVKAPARVEIRTGSTEEVGRLADEDLAAEELVINEQDRHEVHASSADGAADNIGSVYDETEY